jgi:aromatic-amino-acid transaminase
MTSIFQSVATAPADPILGLNEKFASDANPLKVNLGVGSYYNDEGELPVLACVREVEQAMVESPSPRGYLPIDGLVAYDTAVRSLVFGAASEPVVSGRIATIQSVGGTGALKVGADFLRKLTPQAKVLVSEPTWNIHRELFENVGFTVENYPYYDAAGRGIDFEGLLAALNSSEPRTIVLLHACCHNPTGYDLTPVQWDQIIGVIKAKQLMPFVDMAYQGLGFGLVEDGAVIEKFVQAGLTFFVASSFSKSMCLYGERIGSLSVVCASKDEATRVLSQLKVVIRSNYSNPPIHGAAVVSAILNDPARRVLWERELGEMRMRIKAIRQRFVEGLKAAGVAQDMSFMTEQLGMFSYSGLSKEQMIRLRSEFSIYGTDTGRICVAALTSRNIDYVCRSVAHVMADGSS